MLFSLFLRVQILEYNILLSQTMYIFGLHTSKKLENLYHSLPHSNFQSRIDELWGSVMLNSIIITVVNKARAPETQKSTRHLCRLHTQENSFLFR